MIGDADNLSVPEMQVAGVAELRDGHFTIQRKEDGTFTLTLYDGMETAEIDISRDNGLTLGHWLLSK